MQVLTATLRHRELTQEIFNIGDEVATFIENIAEAIADWDVELVEDCVAEFEDIIGDARTDSRTIIRELKGIRQALTSGLASGTVAATMSDGDEQMKRPTPMNAQLLRNQFPITNNSPVMVQEINHILQDRTELVRQYLAHIVDWELAETEKAVRSAEDITHHVRLHLRRGDERGESVAGSSGRRLSGGDPHHAGFASARIFERTRPH